MGEEWGRDGGGTVEVGETEEEQCHLHLLTPPVLQIALKDGFYIPASSNPMLTVRR